MFQMLTVSVVAEVEKLVVPLGDDTESILKESDDNEKAANGWKVTVQLRQQ